MSRTVDTGPVNIAAAEARKQALHLRKLGKSYQAIADEMGCSRAMAYKRVRKALAAITLDDAEDLQRLELHRLDQLQFSLLNGVIDGDPGAVTATLRVMERRAKLLGLDAPDKHQHEIDYTQVSTEELEAAVIAAKQLRERKAG